MSLLMISIIAPCIFVIRTRLLFETEGPGGLAPQTTFKLSLEGCLRRRHLGPTVHSRSYHLWPVTQMYIEYLLPYFTCTDV